MAKQLYHDKCPSDLLLATYCNQLSVATSIINTRKRAVPDQQVQPEAAYQYQMRAEAEYQRQMTAETANQYHQTGAAQEPSATEQGQNQIVQKFTASFFYGCGVLQTGSGNQCQQLLILTTLATAMRAANVADFYMTKYLSKAQEALGPVIQPFIAGMRRIASAETETEAAQISLVQRARTRIRRFIFSANRTMWFSACELGIFLATSSSCLKTEPNIKVFSGKGIAMLHECKRLLNHSTAAEGLLLARTSTHSTKVGYTILETFLVDKKYGATNTLCQQALRAKRQLTMSAFQVSHEIPQARFVNRRSSRSAC